MPATRHTTLHDGCSCLTADISLHAPLLLCSASTLCTCMWLGPLECCAGSPEHIKYCERQSAAGADGGEYSKATASNGVTARNGDGFQLNDRWIQNVTRNLLMVQENAALTGRGCLLGSFLNVCAAGEKADDGGGRLQHRGEERGMVSGCCARAGGAGPVTAKVRASTATGRCTIDAQAIDRQAQTHYINDWVALFAGPGGSWEHPACNGRVSAEWVSRVHSVG